VGKRDDRPGVALARRRAEAFEKRGELAQHEGTLSRCTRVHDGGRDMNQLEADDEIDVVEPDSLQRTGAVFANVDAESRCRSDRLRSRRLGTEVERPVGLDVHGFVGDLRPQERLGERAARSVTRANEGDTEGDTVGVRSRWHPADDNGSPGCRCSVVPQE